jgi:hypothetical protein
MLPFPQPQFMPCDRCGASVARTETERHICEPERQLDFEMFRLRDGIEGFESELGEYLDTPRGRFEAWLAERERRRLD